MTTPERGLFDSMYYEDGGLRSIPERKAICERFEQRLADAWLKIDSAQAALERCDDVIIDQGLTAGIEQLQEHREDLEQRLAEAERDARNRDMWKGQCERQAEELTRLRARCGELEKIIDAKNEALYICASHNRLHLGGSHNTVRVAEDALAIAAAPQPAQEQQS